MIKKPIVKQNKYLYNAISVQYCVQDASYTYKSMYMKHHWHFARVHHRKIKKQATITQMAEIF